MSYIEPHEPELNPYRKFKLRPSIPNIIQILTFISGVKVSDRRKILPLHHVKNSQKFYLFKCISFHSMNKRLHIRTTGFLDFFPLSGILGTRKQDISETKSLSVLRCGGEDTYSVGFLRQS
jgi:hypothetical protein